MRNNDKYNLGAVIKYRPVVDFWKTARDQEKNEQTLKAPVPGELQHTIHLTLSLDTGHVLA